ncbi:CPBP family intramembrane metalloprotease [Flavobacteriaceae bacterium S0825]|uniref:CPBP family intramembrane glutamic endopeptidase n=1 Tax=Gaetbulibacter sp. S0825 TaxID=2720084 RepID=UPI00142F9A92|nr:CPBP family intramembrane glutamic endopeptidase [Gaetbulibacter sp. S0825]MCK0108843.1 CPBP family intramembrane metalloprotease [Flavobacteriaceae bacterium S0825]NIX64479.1 CPBP family intramembrane metalloprotease [Gaetbulibacter sp. S0825]
MKILFQKHPNASRFVLAIVLFVFVLAISVIVNKGVVKQYFPYTAPLLLIVATWILCKTDKKSLYAIGINLNLKNLSFLPLGVFIGAIALFGAKYVRALYTGETMELSSSINYATMAYAFYFILPQVATEELLFRGYLFKKTIEVSNVIITNIVFSILFMLIHVLDDSVLSNKGAIIMLVIGIPVGHLLFATALLKSKTLFFPIGLHLGNNWSTRHLITNSNSGDSILYISNVATFDAWTSFLITIILFNGFFLLVTLVIWKWDKILTLFKR